MKRLPNRPDIDHLRKQAKTLLALWRDRDLAAIDRVRNALPAAVGRNDETIANLGLRLHDAQSCIAREYGFLSWADLKIFVKTCMASNKDQSDFVLHWLRLIYAADVAGGTNLARPSVAAHMLTDNPALPANDPYLACAVGNEIRLRQAIKDDPAWVNRPGGPLNLPPLVAVTHSSLLRLPTFRERLRASARLLLEMGADPDQAVGSRWPPASLSKPSEAFRLSALYGAAGQNHDPELTKLLLDAGANPNDGESLYHSVENLDCMRQLLAADRRVCRCARFG